MKLEKISKKFPVTYAAKIFEEMLKQYVVIYVTTGYTLNAIIYLPVNMMNYVRRITTNLSSALNALIANYLLD